MSDKKTDMTGLIVRKSPGFGIRSLGLKCCFYVQSSVDFGKLFSLDLIFLICKMGLPMPQMVEVSRWSTETVTEGSSAQRTMLGGFGGRLRVWQVHRWDGG